MVSNASSTAAPMKTDLEENAIGLLGATMQCITHISPAIAAFFYTAFVVGLAGLTAPLAYFAGFVLVLLLGNTLVQFSKHLPSAGSYYTYVSRAHPSTGRLPHVVDVHPVFAAVRRRDLRLLRVHPRG